MYQIMNAYSGIMDTLRKLNMHALQKNKTKRPDNREKNHKPSEKILGIFNVGII